MILNFFIIIFILEFSVVDPSHFYGGTITARPENVSQTTGTVQLIVRERWSWRKSYYPVASRCTNAIIAAQTPMIGDGSAVACVSGAACGSHWSTGGATMNTYTWCTDYSENLDTHSGEYYNTYPIPINASFSICFASNAWLNAMGSGSGGSWSVCGRISTVVRPDGYLNTSPVAVSLPIIYKQVQVQHTHVVQMSDFDGSDTLICRWATSSGNVNGADECAGICRSTVASVPASLTGSNCTMSFTLPRARWYYGVALQIEDFYDSAAVTANKPMSSVPMQFLFYGYNDSSSCSTPPAIIGERPNRACIGVPINVTLTLTVIVQIFCSGKNISDFISTVPRGVTKGPITKNTGTGNYEMILTWTPRADQYGPQGICMAAIDNTNIPSNQWCITYLVGFDSPEVIRPKLVQGSASPIGTVFQNQTTFSIQTSKFVNRPTRNGTTIYFNNVTGGIVQQFDCGWDPHVTYTGYTIVINFDTAPWVPGQFYYVTMDSGVASGTEFCGPESAPMYDPTFWVFNIWNPAVSSTTTTTTTPFTTVTVTTKPTSTTSINTLLTTTGIVITTTSVVTTTVTTSTSTTATTTTPLTVSTTTTESILSPISPKDFEEYCRQSIALMTSLILIALMPVHGLAMYGLFTKLDNTFNPSRIRTKQRHKQRMKRIL
ncbi:unnamed protein product [Adineta ricciae]|uniref:Uncharacterized protein n=1 Tax=Adineta ricciae TaxID=249248 RepID=A0A815RI96_ADIRI|nr:unnamed protein product [Adineta ricciae]